MTISRVAHSNTHPRSTFKMSAYLNPFEILTKSISKPQSIALAVVYGVLGAALAARRLHKLTRHKGMYNLLILFSASE